MTRRRWILLGAALVVLVVVGGALYARAQLAPSPPDRSHPTTTLVDAAGHPPVGAKVTCTTALGDLSTDVEYHMVDHSEPVVAGGPVSMTLAMPFVQVDLPIAVDFVSGTTHLSAPEGMRITEASMDATESVDFTSAEVTVDPDGGGLTFTIAGSFPMNGTVRNVPLLHVAGTVTGAAGEEIVVVPPDQVTSRSDAGIFGTQDSTCRVVDLPTIARIPIS